MTPTDDMAFVGDPPLWRPEADEVHVSVTFTWDVDEAQRLRAAWAQYYPVARIGGPAWDSPAHDFEPGRYVRPGVTITSRGCNRRCPWCLVPGREGRMRLLPIREGHIVLDNNLLQTGREHMAQVFAMLQAQPERVNLCGGLDARLVDEWVADQIRTLRIDQLFLAADTDAAIPALHAAVRHLSFVPRHDLRCYVLIGRDGDMERDCRRLEAVWEAGCTPFAQLFQPLDRYIDYSPAWRDFARRWSRPAMMAAAHR
jgi:hypothetical protein